MLLIVGRLLFNLVLFLLPATPFAVAAFRIARTSREEWKLLAWVPVLPLAIWGVVVAWAVTRDRTSHNLWPFEMVFWAILSAALLCLVLIGRRFATRSQRPPGGWPDRDRP